MILCFWLFVFGVHFVHSLRSNEYRNRFQNDDQRSYTNGAGEQEIGTRWPESNLESKSRDQTERSDEDQLTERNYVTPDSDSYSSTLKKVSSREKN